MRVNVVKPFPYSPHGFDNAQAEAGVQELPDHIAAAALQEGWAEPAPAVAPASEGPAAGGSAPGAETDTRTHELNADDAIELVNGVEDLEVLARLERGEVAHPKHEGGRKTVLAAIADTREVLTELATEASTQDGDGAPPAAE